MGRKTPLLSLALPAATLSLAAACLLAQAFPATATLLVYDRQAVLAGELWRLWTGHLVHFSPSHLFPNLLVFVAAGSIVERQSSSGFGLFCAAAAGFIAASLLVFEPEMHTFGGLSGLAVGAVCSLGVRGIRQGGARRLLGWTVLCLAAAKLLLEALQGEPLLAAPVAEPFVPALLAHAAGMLAGVVFGLSSGQRLSSSPGASREHPRWQEGCPGT